MLGYIKLYRKMLHWEWYNDPNVVRVYLHCLLLANYTDKKWQGKIIKKGQLVSSISKIGDDLSLSYQQVRTALDKLVLSDNITKTSTPKNLIITLNDWEKYQLDTDEVTSTLTTNQQSNNNQITTPKEIKNLRKKEEKKKDIYTAHPSHLDVVINDVVKYLNKTISGRYTTTNKGTIRTIKNLVNQGYEVDDFKLVIDKKAKEWLHTDMQMYLRPETLFGNKFESYLNTPTTAILSKSNKDMMDIMSTRLESTKALELSFDEDLF